MSLRRLLALLAVAIAVPLAACESVGDLTWYQDRCARAGLAKGTPAYRDCIAREEAFLEENRRINAPGDVYR